MVIFWALGGSFFGALDGFRNRGGVSEIGGGDSFVFRHHPTQRGCLIFTALALKRLNKKLNWLGQSEARISEPPLTAYCRTHTCIIVMPCDHSRPAVQEVYQIHLGLFIYTSGSEDRHGGPALNTLLVLNEDTSDSEETVEYPDLLPLRMVLPSFLARTWIKCIQSNCQPKYIQLQ